MTDIRKLRDFLIMATRHASRYGRDLDPPARSLFGALLWLKDDDDIVTLREMKNAVWVKRGGKSYAICYDLDTQTLEIREKTTQGRRLHAFAAGASVAEIWKAVSDL